MMKDFIKRTLLNTVSTLISFFLVVLILVGAATTVLNDTPDVKSGSWLVVDIYGSLTEYDPPGDIASRVMGGDTETLQRILENLEKASVDDNIEGVLMKLSSANNAGMAKLQEIRQAVDMVQAAGKKVYAYGDALNVSTLFLAAGCDSIFMPEGGYFEFKGIASGSMHVRGALDKLGIKPHLHKIKDYKAATEMVMDKQMSPEAREMRTWIMDEFWSMIAPKISEERGLDETRLVELMLYAEFEPVEAVEAGLIDAVMYWQDIKAMLNNGDDDLRTVDMATYGDITREQAGLPGGDLVAVVHAQGNIGGRESRIDPALGIMMGHESVAFQLRRCRLDDDVKAVVFRIDSGGGESLASDLIAYEVELLATQKPVVVSMVDVAASGGYKIAYKATKMMADPLSITGSIGSINGFFNMKGFYDKIGVTKDFVTKGPMALLGSDYRDPTDEEWERHTDAHWRRFNTWLADVAEYRGMEFTEAEKLAHGRIWTGRQAVANGLIDATGNIFDAIRLAADLAEIPADEAPSLVHLPEKQSLLELVFAEEKPVDKVLTAMRWQAYRLMRQEVSMSVNTVMTQTAAGTIQ
jgi:protease IV